MTIPHSWNLIGDTPGPRVVILGGTHGDERTGVVVVRTFLYMCGVQDRPAGDYPVPGIHGVLCFVFGNPQAIQQNTRSASGGKDLNRQFIQTELDRPPTIEDSVDLFRARELAPLLARTDYLFDIHATSNDSPPFVVCASASPAHHKLISLLPVAYTLTDPSNILSQEEGAMDRGTTDSYVAAHGGVALGYETGKEDDLRRVEQITDDLIRLLQAVGTIGSDCTIPRLKKPTAHQAVVHQQIFALTHSVQARSAEFEYAPGMDAGWQMVAKGQVIGTYRNGETETAPSDGMLVFPKSREKIATGKNLYFIACFVENVMVAS